MDPAEAAEGSDAADAVEAAAAADGGGPTRAAAFRLLEQYFEADMLTLAQLQFHKGKFEELRASVLETYAREKQLLRQAKALNSALLTEQIAGEKQATRRAEELARFLAVDRDKERALKQLAECVDRDAVLSFEVTELQRELAELLARKEEILAAHAELMAPELKALGDEVAALGDESARADAELAKEAQRKREALARLAFLQQENARLADAGAGELKRLQQLAHDPARLEKQADVVQRAVDGLEKEAGRQRELAAERQAALDEQQRRLREAEAVQRELALKLEAHRETIDQRQRDVDHVTLHLREEQNTHVLRLADKTRLELSATALAAAARREAERGAQATKRYDGAKRELKKRRALLDASRALLPNLEAQVADARHELAALAAHNKAQAQRQREVKQQVDALIARFLQREEGEKQQGGALAALAAQVAALEAEVAQWAAEEGKQRKLAAMLTAQRELKAREAAAAAAHERETQQALKMKELVILDLAKKWHETSAHLKEFSALYDVVKNERNKYVNLIQAAAQALAEMKAKIKLLLNEVEVLRNESLAKDKALAKERLAHATAQCSRDSLRLDANKSSDAYRGRQAQVEQQIAEIDKLNGVIAGAERALLRLKSRFELAVDARNAAGVQLIDRNDELCILYDKANAQAQALGAGELAAARADQELRMLRIRLADLQRQLENARRQLPALPRLAAGVLAVQAELRQERDVTELLCRDLETPKNAERWRRLEGEDPDAEALAQRLAALEARYSRKKEQLLEKELVLEEVSALADQLRAQAAARRGETLALAARVNGLQARVKDATRAMMAVVSELAMYQATAVKLQHERLDAARELDAAAARVAAGQPPAADSEQALARAVAQRLRAAERRGAKRQARAAAQRARDFPSQLAFTTAEARPNAYVPDELGLPRPYGALAPFKPSQPGASMRHTRAPQRRDIDI